MIINKALSGFHLLFDTEDAQETIYALKTLLGTRKNMGIALENSVSTEYKELLFSYSDNINDCILLTSSSMNLCLSHESIEFAIHKLSLFLSEGDFSEPEFCECTYKKKVMSIYFMKKRKPLSRNNS